jgi:hypothetical protein
MNFEASNAKVNAVTSGILQQEHMMHLRRLKKMRALTDSHYGDTSKHMRSNQSAIDRKDKWLGFNDLYQMKETYRNNKILVQRLVDLATRKSK